MNQPSEKTIYQHDVLEFAQVAVQFCALLEQCGDKTRRELTETLLKLIPLLYLKAELLPDVESDGAFLPDDQVTEQDYDFVRCSLAGVLGNEDEYLDVVFDEMMQTDDTQWKRISENLADVYQPVRNFLATYQGGLEDCMQDALWALKDNFELYWGESLVDALRRLHRIKYAIKNDDDEDSEE
ncbi:MAG: DUF5063 domain-containing protein [Bacteroidaceae bacterium]|nr:DUF5063 domain-containing protein [Bacteroidaceae bacterium]